MPDVYIIYSPPPFSCRNGYTLYSLPYTLVSLTRVSREAEGRARTENTVHTHERDTARARRKNNLCQSGSDTHLFFIRNTGRPDDTL